MKKNNEVMKENNYYKCGPNIRMEILMRKKAKNRGKERWTEFIPKKAETAQKKIKNDRHEGNKKKVKKKRINKNKRKKEIYNKCGRILIVALRVIVQPPHNLPSASFTAIGVRFLPDKEISNQV